MKRALLALLGGLIGGALAPLAVQAGVESVRMIQAGWVGTAASTLVMGSNYATFGTDPADAGIIRIANGGGGGDTGICWEASPAGTDQCILNDNGETLYLNGWSALQASIGSVVSLSMEGANLTAGACTANTIRLDTTSTRELCICNAAGSAYDCWSATTANGPSD
jgi:hypothetical protein